LCRATARQVIDRAALGSELACECYRIDRAGFDRLL
jgi:hypothetical protein